jgi:hypothetical protein
VAYWVIQPEEVAAEQFAGAGAEELPAAEAAYSEAA